MTLVGELVGGAALLAAGAALAADYVLPPRYEPSVLYADQLLVTFDVSADGPVEEDTARLTIVRWIELDRELIEIAAGSSDASVTFEPLTITLIPGTRPEDWACGVGRPEEQTRPLTHQLAFDPGSDIYCFRYPWVEDRRGTMYVVPTRVDLEPHPALPVLVTQTDQLFLDSRYAVNQPGRHWTTRTNRITPEGRHTRVGELDPGHFDNRLVFSGAIEVTDTQRLQAAERTAWLAALVAGAGAGVLSSAAATALRRSRSATRAVTRARSPFSRRASRSRLAGGSKPTI